MPSGGPFPSPGRVDRGAHVLDQLLLVFERLHADAEGDVCGVQDLPLAVLGEHRLAVVGRDRGVEGLDPLPRQLLAGGEEVGGRSAGADLGLAAAGELAAKPVLGEDALLEGRHPLQELGVAEVVGAHGDVELARDPGRILELVQIAHLGQILGNELGDLGLDRDARCDQPAAERQGGGDGQDAAWAADGGCQCLRAGGAEPLPNAVTKRRSPGHNAAGPVAASPLPARARGCARSGNRPRHTTRGRSVSDTSPRATPGRCVSLPPPQ